jgi:tetratricopeptide (TPR) repeat protein
MSSTPITASRRRVVSDDSLQNANKRLKPDDHTVTTNATFEAIDIHCNNNNNIEYDEGMFVFRKELNPRLQLHGTAALYYNVALTHISRKHYADAKVWLDMALYEISPSRCNILIPTLQPDTGVTLNDDGTTFALIRIHHNRGYCLYQLGQMKESFAAYQEALSLITEKFEQKQQFDRKVSLLYREYQALSENCIAVLVLYKKSSETSNSATAMALFTRSLSTLEDIFGKNAKHVGTIWNNIGRLHYQDGNYADALEAYKRSLHIRCKQRDSNSLDVAATTCNAAQAYHRCGDYDKAIDHYLHFLSIAEPHFGSYHCDVACIYNRMAELYHTKKVDHVKSKFWYMKALTSFKLTFGASHPIVATVLSQLGNLLSDMKNYEEALVYHSEALEIKQSLYLWNDPHITAALTSIAQVYYKLGYFMETLVLYDQIHLMQIAVHGNHSLEVAATLASIAQIHYHKQNYDSSFELYQQVLTIQRCHHGENGSTALANTLSMMGLVLFQKGELDLAKTCFVDSLRISLPLLGPNNSDIAIIWYNLASIHLKCGDEESASQLYSESLRIERLAFNVSDETTYGITVTLQHLAVVHQRNGDYELAAKYLSEALNFERKKEKNCTRSIAQLLNSIGTIHLQTGSVGPMMSCFIEASRIFKELGDPNESLSITGIPLYVISKLHPPSPPVA